METSKICTKCKIKKSYSEFNKRNDRKSGITSSCIKCNNEIRRINKALSYKKLTVEEKAKINKKAREHRHNNIEETTKKSKEYYLNNREKIIQKVKDYKKTINGKIVKRCTQSKRRNNKKISSDKTINKQSLLKLKEMQNSKCYYCECVLDFKSSGEVHLDHYVPLSKGGTHTIGNVVWSCVNCNLRKSAKKPTTLLIL